MLQDGYTVPKGQTVKTFIFNVICKHPDENDAAMVKTITRLQDLPNVRRISADHKQSKLQIECTAKEAGDISMFPEVNQLELV